MEAHLEECPECRRRREAMQASLPVVRAPKRALAFLKKVKRTRLIAAVLSAVVALLLIFLVYDSEYHWRGDLPSLTQGLQDYLGWTDHLEGCAIEALAATEVDGTLYVSFTSDSEDNVHGVAELDRGLNGKYQFVSASYSPFPYTGGVFLHSSEDLWLFAGVGCREIYGFTAQFEVYDSQGLDRVVPVTFPVQEDTFLLAVPKDELDRLQTAFPNSAAIPTRDAYDYLYRAEDLQFFRGKKLSGQRNHVNKFLKTYGNWSFRVITPEDLPAVGAFLDRYAAGVDKPSASFHEDLAKTREVLGNYTTYDMLGGMLLVEGEIVGFSLGEIVGDTLFTHIEKADRDYQGCYQMLVAQFAQQFAQDGVHFINREDDAGDPGLRKSKLSYHPVTLLEKYLVTVDEPCKFCDCEDT